MHRDYARRGPVRVCWQSNDLIISNPGGFVEGVSVENLLTTEPRPRNPALADAFKRLGLVERTGRGVDIIYSGMLRFGRPAPDYSESVADMVKLTISTEPADLGFVRLVLQEEVRQKGELPVETLLVLTALRNARLLSADQLAGDLQRSKSQTARVLKNLLSMVWWSHMEAVSTANICSVRICITPLGNMQSLFVRRGLLRFSKLN